MTEFYRAAPGWNGVALWLALVALCNAGAAADQGVRTQYSPDHRARLSSVAVGSPDEPHYRLWLSIDHANRIALDDYIRDVDVSWSADSRYLAFTDWIVSNVADCHLVDITEPRDRRIMAAALPALPFHVLTLHFYVSCRGWTDPRHVSVRVTGHTDDPPLHAFDYAFSYDALSRRMTLVSRVK